MNFQLQPRDEKLLGALHEYGGVLTRRQIKEMFFKTKNQDGKTAPVAGWRAMEKRLKKLKESQYIVFPTEQEYRSRPIPEPLVWLGWKGALIVAKLHGLTLEAPTGATETGLRELERLLRERGIRWLREPRYSQLAHDVLATDLRMALEKSIVELPDLSLEQWVSDSEFRADADIVEYTVVDRSGLTGRESARVIPDGYFVVLDERLAAAGKPPRGRYMLELDNGTHPNERFANEKVRRFGAYIRSRAFRERFADNKAYCLVVTSSPTRMRYLMRQTEKSGGSDASLFLFTTFHDLWIDPEQLAAVRQSQRRGDWPSIEPYQVNALTAPVWSMVGRTDRFPLFTR